MRKVFFSFEVSLNKSNTMASTSETGHAKNIANLKGLNEINAGFGADYNPSNPLLILSTMQAQHDNCNALQNAVNAQEGIFFPYVNTRHDEFAGVKTLTRQVRNAAKVCGGSDAWLKQVNAAVTKILGERVSKAKPSADDPAGTSASQQSFDNTVNNFGLLVQVLKNEPLYAPNEAALKVSTLDGKHTALDKANNKVKEAVVPYSKALRDRNKALYATKTGLCDVGQASKDYVRSAFGFKSPEFKLVTKFVFKQLVKVD